MNRFLLHVYIDYGTEDAEANADSISSNDVIDEILKLVAIA